MKHIILIGFMGSGKSTIGKELAKTMGRTFLDTDDRIEEQQQMKISTIFEKYGEVYFRDLETKVLKDLLEEQEPLVIAVGGGLPMRFENRAYLKQLGKVVYLTAEVDTLVQRLEGDTTRPILQGGDLRKKIVGLMEARGSIYEEATDCKVHTDQKSCAQIVEEIIKDVQ